MRLNIFQEWNNLLLFHFSQVIIWNYKQRGITIMDDEKQWYTNKELFEQINQIKSEFQSVQMDMKETTNTLKGFTALTDNLRNDIEHMKSTKTVKSNIFNGVKEWTGWLVAILMLVVTILQN